MNTDDRIVSALLTLAISVEKHNCDGNYTMAKNNVERSFSRRLTEDCGEGSA